ncbi:hypothetical protein BS47DRAFT_1038573 [Hydnum rufescens UP504]|uniref:Nitrogen regulatory protein areA GATA-like domain-containing protein n=1 Tax=Hydnum rufescens UP504 TaxID=1448309 RepID=A0A9P6AVW5_9AGAM|nr:hypothetical protein BS47DRAFT_1038573 [Hydnum rufescens UP504]
MAEYIPGTSVTRSAAMSALHHAHKAPDDNDVDVRESVMNVDYLSHEWQEEADVWASWRHTTRHKYDIANGVRLENASWRTWWKQRNNLKTVSPETLNWLKDSDVTWLYGPLHTAADPVPPAKVATTEDRLDLVKAMGKKPILKHRSISELFNAPRSASPSLEAVSAEMASLGEDRSSLLHTKSDPHILPPDLRRPSPPRAFSGSLSGIIPRDSSSSPRVSSDGENTGTRKHISFNTFVEQCIAIDKPRGSILSNGMTTWEAESALPYDEDHIIYEEDDEDLLTMRSSSSSSAESSRAPSLRRPSLGSHSSSVDNKERVTIAPIAPTMLKTFDFSPGQSPAVVFVPPQGSHFPQDPSSMIRFSSQATLRLGSPGSGIPQTPGPPTRSQWDDEDDNRCMGFDYFGGPDNGVAGEYGPSAQFRPSTQRNVLPDRGEPSYGRSFRHGAAIRAVSGTFPTSQAGPTSGLPPTLRVPTTPGRSILKQSAPDTSGAAVEPAHDASDKVDTYLSGVSGTIPPTSTASAPINNDPPPVPRQPSANNILAPAAPENLFSPPLPSRGRSTVRMPMNVEQRERSSSKGSSPIGSVSPSSRPPSVLGRPIVKAVNIGNPLEFNNGPVTPAVSHQPSSSTVPSQHSTVEAYHSPPLPDNTNGRSRIPSSSVSRSSVLPPPDASGQRRIDHANGTSFKNPPYTSEPTSRSLDAALPEAESARSHPTHDRPGKNSGSLRRATTTVTDDDGVPDGGDAYSYHSINPTPSNSPISTSRPLPSVSSTISPSHHRRSSSGVSTGRPQAPGIIEEDGTLVSRAVEIVSSAKGLLGAIWNAGVGVPASPVESYPSVNGRRASDV